MNSTPEDLKNIPCSFHPDDWTEEDERITDEAWDDMRKMIEEGVYFSALEDDEPGQ